MNNNGPIFIIGVGRSGTTLLRSILNNHSKISLPDIESQFIPHFLKKFHNSNKNKPSVYIDYFFFTTFYLRKSQEKRLDEYILNKLSQVKTPEKFIEIVLKYYSSKFESMETFNFLWGDKTPFYIRDIRLLFQAFPNAKFIHIIRDPRDVALSYSKTWGKNLFASAEKWRDIIQGFEKDKQIIINNYLELYYEDLLMKPEKEIERICNFLRVEYEKKMLVLNSPVEFFGRAKGKAEIVSSNSKNYEKDLSKIQIKRVEEITKPILLEKNYKLTNDVNYRPLSKLKKISYRIIDAYKLYKHLVLKQNGLILGSKILFSSILKHK